VTPFLERVSSESSSISSEDWAEFQQKKSGGRLALQHHLTRRA